MVFCNPIENRFETLTSSIKHGFTLDMVLMDLRHLEFHGTHFLDEGRIKLLYQHTIDILVENKIKYNNLLKSLTDLRGGRDVPPTILKYIRARLYGLSLEYLRRTNEILRQDSCY